MSINPVIYIYFNGFYRKEFCRILKTLKSSGSELSLFLLVPILNFKAKLSKKTLKYTFVNVLFFDTFFFARRPIKSLSVNHVTHKNCSTATSNVDIPQPPTMAYRSPQPFRQFIPLQPINIILQGHAKCIFVPSHHILSLIDARDIEHGKC